MQRHVPSDFLSQVLKINICLCKLKFRWNWHSNWSILPNRDVFWSEITNTGCFSILICASSFPFLASFPRVLAPPHQDAREGCMEKTWGKDARRNWMKWKDISSLPLASLQSVISCKMDLPLCCLSLFFKTFKININEARCPVEIYDMYGLFKLQR